VGAISAGSCERVSSHHVEAIATDTRNARLNGAAPVLAGDKMVRGATLSTGAGGYADLMLLPNILLRLEENSELRITDLKFSADGNETAGGVRERVAAVQLVRGRVIARLENHGYSTTSFAFQTTRGQTRAEADALFEITERPEASSATCIRGYLDIAPASGERVSTLGPGETMRMDDAGSRHFELSPAQRASTEARCAHAEAALQYETTAQMETRR
jgi:hypothetical protein